jgi:hypothetical protein
LKALERIFQAPALRENLTSIGTDAKLVKLFQNDPNVSGTWFCPAKITVREAPISRPLNGWMLLCLPTGMETAAKGLKLNLFPYM